MFVIDASHHLRLLDSSKLRCSSKNMVKDEKLRQRIDFTGPLQGVKLEAGGHLGKVSLFLHSAFLLLCELGDGNGNKACGQIGSTEKSNRAPHVSVCLPLSSPFSPLLALSSQLSSFLLSRPSPPIPSD